MRPDRIVIGADDERAIAHAAQRLRAVPAQPRAAAGDGRALGRAHQVRGQRDARDAHLVHERAREPRRAARRRHRARCARASAPIRASASTSSIPASATAARCFPKDVKALQRTAQRAGAAAAGAGRRRGRQRRAEARARRQDRRALRRRPRAAAASRCGASRSSRTPTTCARRQSRVIIDALLRAARRSSPTIRWRWTRRSAFSATRRGLTFAAIAAGRACEGADALVVVTEWKEFRSPDFDALRAAAEAAGRSSTAATCTSPTSCAAPGFEYFSIGRR